jgi:hypothetical protein
MIFWFVRKDKEQVLVSFTLGEFLKKYNENKNIHSPMFLANEFVKEDKSHVDQINDFFNSGDSEGDGSDEGDDGGE